MKLLNNVTDVEEQRILVVDDELVSRLYIEQALLEEGYIVDTAENGKQAIARTREKSPDMIVMDVMMPVVDGYAACREIRKTEDGIHRPIMMLTGLDDHESVEKSFAAGATDFIVKPINIPIFKQRIRRGLLAYKNTLTLYDQQQRLIHAQAVAKMGYWDWNVQTNEVYWSDEVYKIISVSRESFSSSRDNMMVWVHAEDKEKVQQALFVALKNKTNLAIEHRVAREDGKLQVVSQNAELILGEDSSIVRLSGIIQDVTEKYLSQREIRYLAYYDSLTDLPNRVYFCEQLNRMMQRAQGRNKEVAIAIMDLDRFQNINNSLGHEVGDAMLVTLAQELKLSVGDDVHLGKFAGVKFGFFTLVEQENELAIAAVTQTMNQAIETISKEYDINGNAIVCTASAGVTISSQSNSDVDLLLLQADRAMAEAREQGGDRFCFYNDEMESHAHHLLKFEHELRHAIRNNELVVYYQPKCSVTTNKILGMEALVRWEHPQKGLVPPNDFISVAEDTGLIVPIGLWVLQQACIQTNAWHKQGFDELVISINVSAKQFHSKGFLADVLRTVKESGVRIDSVDLEITESCTMNSIERAIELLDQLRQAGIRISMDDFGTGFSSLSFLQRLPLDTLKVDREFIKDIGPEGENSELAKLIIAVATQLELSVVAEGVETEDHLTFLRKCNCDEYQGYLISPALPPGDFESLLEKENT